MDAPVSPPPTSAQSPPHAVDPPRAMPDPAPYAEAAADAATRAAEPNPLPAGGPDLGYVWREVRKRVFLKLPFAIGIKDALEAAVPIILDQDHFVVGLMPRDMPLASNLTTQHVKNTIENILASASGRAIHFEVVEGVTPADWQVVRDRRRRAQEAVIAMAQQSSDVHHFDDVLNQIVGEIRSRVTGSRDRTLPQVRAQMLLDVVPSLADAEEMLFPDPDAHEARRSMARAMDRVASFLEIQPIMLALEVERYRREQVARYRARQGESANS